MSILLLNFPSPSLASLPNGGRYCFGTRLSNAQYMMQIIRLATVTKAGIHSPHPHQPSILLIGTALARDTTLRTRDHARSMPMTRARWLPWNQWAYSLSWADSISMPMRSALSRRSLLGHVFCGDLLPKPIRTLPPMTMENAIVLAPAAETIAPIMMNELQMMAAYVAPQ